jgi:hypothetical protein
MREGQYACLSVEGPISTLSHTPERRIGNTGMHQAVIHGNTSRIGVVENFDSGVNTS